MIRRTFLLVIACVVTSASAWAVDAVLTSNKASAIVNDNTNTVTLTVNVTGATAGTRVKVKFFDNGEVLGSNDAMPDASGNATITRTYVVFTSTGAHEITGDITIGVNTTVVATTNSVTINVTAATPSLAVSLSANNSTVNTGESVTFTANVTNGTPSTAFSVEFKDGGTTIGTGSGTTDGTGAGTATYAHTTGFSTTGSHTVTAVATQSGATGSPATSSGVTITVNAPPLAVTVSADNTSPTTSQAVVFTANVTGAPPSSSVSVEFKDGGASIGTGTGTTDGSGNATITYTYSSGFSTAGSHTITAHATQGANTADSTSITITVTAATVLTVSISADNSTVNTGQAVIFTANVTGGAASTSVSVNFKDGATSIGTGTGTTDGSGNATITYTHSSGFSSTGTHNITAHATQGANTADSTSIAITVNSPSSLAVTLSANNTTVNTGESVIFTASVTNGTPSASFSVEFKDGGTSLGTGTGTTDGTGAGTATYTHSAGFGTIGSHTVTAVATQSGATGSPATSSGVAITVNAPNVLTISITADNPAPNAGDTVTFTANVAGGTPGEAFTVTFKNGGTTLGTAPGTFDAAGNGTATFAYAGFTTSGTFAISAIAVSASQSASGNTTTDLPITVDGDALPDPTRDEEVIGVVNAQTSTAERFLRLQTGNIRSRLTRLRSGGATGARNDSFTFTFNNTSSYDRSAERNGESPARSATATLTSDSAYANAVDVVSSRTWSIWGDSMVSVGTDRKGENDNDHTTFGGTIGVDRFFGECFAAGIALGYAHDKTDVGNRGSETKGDAYTAALYASWSHPTGFYVDGSAGYSRLNLDSTRYTANGFATGDRNGNQYFASLESGYDFRHNQFTFTPFGRMDASTTRLDSYTERGGGGLALNYDKTDINLFSLSAGIRGEYSIAMCWGNLVPSAGIEYTHNFRDTADQRMGYVSEGSMPYLLKSKALGNNQIGANIGLAAHFRNGWSVGSEYRGTYAEKRYDHTFHFSISKSW